MPSDRERLNEVCERHGWLWVPADRGGLTTWCVVRLVTGALVLEILARSQEQAITGAARVAVSLAPSPDDDHARERLNRIAAVLDRGIPDDRKLATITRIVHERPAAPGLKSTCERRPGCGCSVECRDHLARVRGQKDALA